MGNGLQSAPLAALLTRPALELAALVRSGEVRSHELVEAVLQQMRVHHDLNAFTSVDAEGALAAARAIQPGDARPFAGVPIAIKELQSVAGQPFTQCSDLLGEYHATFDTVVVRRLRDAGFILVGRTNAPEFGITPVTESRRFGAAHNPWNPKHTPGGSSGGAAAAVAAGIVPIANASDSGGSIRGPAACCGLVGLKANRGRVPLGPGSGDALLSTVGVVTRTVADTAALLDVLAGPETGDATWLPPPSHTFAASARQALPPLRIGLTTRSPLGTHVDATCADAAYQAATMLTRLGHHVDLVSLPGWPDETLPTSFTTVWASLIASGVRACGRLVGREPSAADMEPLTWMFYTQGNEARASTLVEAQATLEQYARRLIASFANWDLLLTPTMGQPPLPIGAINPCGDDPAAEWTKAATFSAFTPIWNITGQPAVTLPLIHGTDGLPRGIQLIGPPLGEGLLLAVATQLEQAYPWSHRVPNPPTTTDTPAV